MAKTYKLLQVQDLNTSFKISAGKVLAVNGVSFELEEGKILGIVGESGSGKSVTAYSIMQILDKNGHIDSGKILYHGTDLVKLSNKEMRKIRGNKISIIFQDAMTSLNPTWTVGNQLREAILVHAKKPIEQATYNIANEIRSDKQRIILINKGISHHPENEELKKDLRFVEEKLIKDQEEYARIKEKAIKDLKELKAKKRAEYKAKRPEFNKAIREALIGVFTNFFKLNEKPSNEEIANVAKVKENKIHLDASKAKYDESLKAYLDAKQSKAEKYEIILARQETDVDKSSYKVDKKRYNKAVRKYVNSVVYKNRYDAIQKYKDARKVRYEFYWEGISEYKETKYSANKKALQMLKEVGITDPERRFKQYPFNMSGGMLQRAMIAMALVERPDILIADEPTTALDVTIQAQILELLKKLQKEYGMAIIIITHDLGVVAQICDEVDIMYAGRIVERGSVRDIFYNPQHEYTKGLLNSMPKLANEKKRLEPIPGNPVDLFALPKGCAFSSRCKNCMQICLDRYPEEVKYDESGHAASCWAMIKRMHEEGKIDVEKGEPTGKPLIYNGAIIQNKAIRKMKKKEGK